MRRYARRGRCTPVFVYVLFRPVVDEWRDKGGRGERDKNRQLLTTTGRVFTTRAHPSVYVEVEHAAGVLSAGVRGVIESSGTACTRYAYTSYEGTVS